MTLFLPPERDRRRDRNRRIRRGYTSLRVTKSTAALVLALHHDLDTLSLDEALFYVAMHELGYQRCAEILAAGAPVAPDAVSHGRHDGARAPR